MRDNGPGIPRARSRRCCSSFGQGSLAHKTAEQGAGLGLPIVQKIMELHQGRFDLFSKLRFGTEVIATFPRARVMDALAPVVERKSRLRIYSEAGERRGQWRGRLTALRAPAGTALTRTQLWLVWTKPSVHKSSQDMRSRNEPGSFFLAGSTWVATGKAHAKPRSVDDADWGMLERQGVSFRHMTQTRPSGDAKGPRPVARPPAMRSNLTARR